jgi:DNA-binding transcriptional LysR family regulator
MNLRQLEAFRAVIEAGTVTRAAETMRVSQPAVSKLIGHLARDCGFELFRRNGNRLIPTAEALTLYGEVERMFVSVEHISGLAAGIRELRSGQLSIAAFPALATRPLPRIITRFLRDHPDTRVSVAGRSGRMLVEWVAANQVDLGIGLLLLEHPGIEYQSAGSVDGVCVLHPCHPLARRKVIRAGDLDDVPFISLGAEDRSRFRIDQAFEGRRVRRRITIEAQQSEAACTFACEGAGIAIVEPFSASEFATDRLVVRPFRPRVQFDIWLMTPTQRPRSLILESFIKLFQLSIASVVSSVGARLLKKSRSRPA